MASLTEIAVTTKKLAMWSVIGFVAYLVVKLLTGLGITYWKTTHPIPIPPPNVAFYKLPYPKFPNAATSSAGFSFILENIEGRPPETTTAGKVYFMPKKSPDFLSSQRAKNFAAKLGFTDEPKELTSTLYRFIDPLEPLRSLEVDIATLNFKLKYDYPKKPQIFFQGQIRSKSEVENEVKDFISSNGLFDKSILNGNITLDLLKINLASNTLIPASSISNSNAVRLNFTRKELDGLKILPPGFNQSYNYALFTASDSIKTKITELFYTFWPIAFDNFATYPLRSSNSAWADLLDGKGTVIRVGYNTPNHIIIRNIYLAYYDSEEPQMFLQPIFVFEGDNNFIAYLPATSEEWLE